MSNEIPFARQLFAWRYDAALLVYLTDDEISGILQRSSIDCTSVVQNHERAVVDMRFAIMEKQMRRQQTGCNCNSYE